MYNRARIHLETPTEVEEFVSLINSDGTADKYILENEDSRFMVDARSYLGVIYASAEWNGKIYIVNKTHNNVYPLAIEKFSY